MDAATTRMHPNQEEFVWDDHHGPFTVLEPGQAYAYDADGYFVCNQLLPQPLIGTLEAAIDPVEKRVADFMRSRREPDGAMKVSRPDEMTFVDHLATLSPAARSLTLDPRLVALAIDLLGPRVRVYQEHAVYKKPGAARPFPWHQDSGYEFTVPQHYVTCWIALTPATVDNGCVWVWPGQHRDGTMPHWPSSIGYVCAPEDGTGVPIEMSPGDVLVFSSLTPHRSGPNLTGAVRKAYIIHYAIDGMYWVEGAARAVCDDARRQYLVAVDGRPLV